MKAPVPTTAVLEDEPPQPTAKEPTKSSSASIVKRLRRLAGTQKRSRPAKTAAPERTSMDVAVALEVMVTVAVAGAEVEMRTLFPAAKEQVGISLTPLGEEVRAQLRLTCPVNPPAGVTVMVDEPVAPTPEMETAVLERVKPAATAGGLTVVAMVVVATTAPLWVAFTVIW